MHIDRSRLLITLALFCALAIGPSRGMAAPNQLGSSSFDSGPASTYGKPRATQNSGEPDAGSGSVPVLTHTSVLMTRQPEATSGSGSSGRYVALALRWAQVFWMARYMGLTP